jgi:pyridoxamine 5'-phosphate oxidase
VLDLPALAADPYEHFAAWSRDVSDAAACLVTASADGIPAGRMVIITDFDGDGFRFFTSYKSPKGLDLQANPRAELVWYWPPDRQVRASGAVERLGDAESDQHWQERPREHQLAVWAAPQSEVVESREALERAVAAAAWRFEGDPVPRPAEWGGYRLVAEWVEFWREDEHRLHDRLRYRREGQAWVVERLAP